MSAPNRKMYFYENKAHKETKSKPHGFYGKLDERSWWGDFDYIKKEINIGTKDVDDEYIFMVICHELMEICACEINVSYRRPDIADDVIFVYDHRKHDSMMNIFSSLIRHFIA